MGKGGAEMKFIVFIKNDKGKYYTRTCNGHAELRRLLDMLDASGKKYTYHRVPGTQNKRRCYYD